jgi:hypothetical protein
MNNAAQTIQDTHSDGSTSGCVVHHLEDRTSTAVPLPFFVRETKPQPRRQSMSRNRYVRKTQDMESIFAMGLSVIGIVVSVLMVALFVREALKGVLQ